MYAGKLYRNCSIFRQSPISLDKEKNSILQSIFVHVKVPMYMYKYQYSSVDLIRTCLCKKKQLFFNSKCPTINTMPSYTNSTNTSSDEDMQLQEMSLNDQLSDYERSVDFTQSRQRHDTITVENEDELNEWSLHQEVSDNSFDVEFEASERSVANNNGNKVHNDSSGVIFQHVSSSFKSNLNY